MIVIAIYIVVNAVIEKEKKKMKDCFIENIL